MRREDCQLIAHIARTHGVEGAVILKFIDGNPDDFRDEELLFVEFDQIVVPFFIASYRVRNTDTAIVAFDDIQSEEAALELLQRPVFVEKQETDHDDNEVPWERLVGLTLIDTTHGHIGTITGILEIPNNDQFEVAYQGREVLVPINDDLIEEIDLEQGLLHMSLPDGLLEIDL